MMLLQLFAPIVSSVTLGVVSALAGYVRKGFSRQREEFDALKVSQRNQLKSSIVRIYDEAREAGYITPQKLDVLNRQAESYFTFDGNSYIKAVVEHANRDFEIRGTLPG